MFGSVCIPGINPIDLVNLLSGKDVGTLMKGWVDFEVFIPSPIRAWFWEYTNVDGDGFLIELSAFLVPEARRWI